MNFNDFNIFQISYRNNVFSDFSTTLEWLTTLVNFREVWTVPRVFTCPNERVNPVIYIQAELMHIKVHWLVLSAGAPALQ